MLSTSASIHRDKRPTFAAQHNCEFPEYSLKLMLRFGVELSKMSHGGDF
jgi:hypothetical protein